ncbi:unnamed protein product [Colias eurytheme]|nr:unnamed protein product [Colias eurytheme]
MYNIRPGMFPGADMSFQGEYAAQVLGLGAEGAPREEPPPPARAPDLPRPQSPKKDAKYPGNVRARYTPGVGGAGTAGEEEGGVLDLRARDPSVISVGSQHSAASEPAGYLDAVRSTVSVYSGNSNSSSDRDILDLSMPDKNCMTEVCYVCGDELRRGALVNLHTKEPKDKCNKQPYFPIFGEQHPRPPRSRPKDAAGTVRACAACHTHLLQQWHAHQHNASDVTTHRISCDDTKAYFPSYNILALYANLVRRAMIKVSAIMNDYIVNRLTKTQKEVWILMGIEVEVKCVAMCGNEDMAKVNGKVLVIVPSVLMVEGSVMELQEL